MEIVYELGSIVQMKKQHPCGSFEWEVVRLGMDIKIKCCTCDRIAMFTRQNFKKSIKKVISL
ncbi:hypothetical protein AwErysi_02800 [Erysipelotrichaceae bacterium]|nr:hypothetical protein AwErysi_02800 [Erysipelotrichaceae bacterium]